MSLLSSIFGADTSTKEENSSLFKKRPLPRDEDGGKVVKEVKEKKQKGRVVKEVTEKKEKKEDESSDSESEGSSSSSDSESDEEVDSKVVEKADSSKVNNEESKVDTATADGEATGVEGEATGDNAKSDKSKDAADRTLFVGNLPSSFTRRSLEKLFRPCGAVESTRIRSVATTGVKVPKKSAGNQKLVKRVSANLMKIDNDVKNSVVGYVVFRSADSMEKALAMNNTQVEDPADTKNSRTIRVDHSQSEFDASRSIFVGNLPYKADEETLRKHFCEGCGIKDSDIEGIRVVRDKDTYQCKGFSYILFADKTMVSTSLRLMHGSTYMKRDLRVLVCSRRFNSNKAEGRPKKKKSAEVSDVKHGVSALRRIIEKEDHVAKKKNKRLRGKKSNSKPTAKKAMAGSKRVVLEAKANKRVKKLEKRVTKGMGKNK
mmetsp:Transcript_19148/g.24643  ORF Transcript_19148/g.24643 Transcript_19148/m.24643 type:complete len:431 (+) Transcript_19148:102-1394(+)